MIVLHHLPRTGGTFIRDQLRIHVAPGPEVSFGDSRLRPRVMHDEEFRPAVLVYHCSGREFETAYRSRAGDFTFTFIRDPVDLVYSNFRYMQLRARSGKAGRAAEWNYYDRDISEHIDDIIRGAVRVSWLHHDLERFDFVGVTERMPESIAALNERLGINLASGPPMNHVGGEDSYRRAELAEVLSAQRRLWQSVLADGGAMRRSGGSPQSV